MTIHVMCLTSNGGIPIFSRARGGDAMNFSQMASLNGVHMFLKSHNVELSSTDLQNSAIVWKEYEDAVVLIVMANGVTKYILDKFMDTVFGAMVLSVGTEDIKNRKNIERLKRDLRVCHPIIDKLLESLDVEDTSLTKDDMINMTECIMSYENHLLQTCLEGYMECLDLQYGCLLVHNCIAVATAAWWALEPLERKLLLVVSTTNGNSIVFLPIKSPNMAYRLISVRLMNHVQVLVLCTATLELSEVERTALQCWRNSIDAMRSAEQCHRRNLPTMISLDSSTLGFLLANYKLEKFILCRNSDYVKNRTSGIHRLDILRTFYHRAVENFILPKTTDSDTGKETYWCSEYHKCHALKEKDHIICVLYTSTVPTHTMRLITQKILKALLIDKQTCWAMFS